MAVVTVTKHEAPAVRPHHRKKLTLHNIFTLCRRLAILAVAVWYIVSSIQSTVASIKVLRGTRNAPMKFEAYETTNLIKYMGNGLVGDSPLVLQVLKNDTTPRNYSLFFDDDGTISPTGCKTPKFNKAVYSNLFMRLGIGSLTRDTYFNNTELVAFELVQPIVDCSFTPLKMGMNTIMRMFYLMRLRSKPSVLGLFAVRFSMQNYRILDHVDEGPIGLTTYAGVLDMRQPNTTYKFGAALGYPFETAKFYPLVNHGLNDEGWWSLTSIVANPLVQPQFDLVTSSRTGFYVKADSEQSNIKNLHWAYNDDPVSAITKWNWKGEPVLRDSWAWVHCIHGYYALDAIINLLILFLVIFRNLQRGKIWVGDAFVSISSRLLLRGFVILLSWVLNGFWALMELCLHDAHSLAGTQEIFFHPEIMHADLLTIHLSVSTLLGYIFRERIDPIIAVVAFEIGWNTRLDLAAGWFPSVLEYIKEYAVRDNGLAVVSVSETVSAYSPLRLWTTHELPDRSPKFVFSCLFPVFSTGVLILVWVVLRKIYHKFRPDQMRVVRDSSATNGARRQSVSSAKGEEAPTYKRNLTIFEVATGAALHSRFGVISDFENYLIIKGMKYASSDGIYSNGFLIVNGKSLLATADLPSVLLMKLLRLRFSNVYTYEIDGTTVQRTAKLVYPESFTWSDLLHLNINVLS